MPKLDPGRLIRHARDLIDDSKTMCERSRHKSKKANASKRFLRHHAPNPTRLAASTRSSTNATVTHIEQQPSFPFRHKPHTQPCHTSPTKSGNGLRMVTDLVGRTGTDTTFG